MSDKSCTNIIDGPRRREAAGVRLPLNRYAHAALRAILTNETGWTTHSILRIASLDRQNRRVHKKENTASGYSSGDLGCKP